ncbi:MAG: hypothetical protein WC979_03140 [Candidatus Pacearchaeota archaeon]|jgi:hypothetical protein|nr:hypothetical protein [Clostridia bacterium]
MLELVKIEVQRVKCYSPLGIFIGWANEYEFNDLRARIAESGAEGYSIEFNGERIPITPVGKIDNWPQGLFDFNEIAISRMFKVQIAKWKKENAEKEIAIQQAKNKIGIKTDECDCSEYPAIHQGPGKPLICSNCNQEL